MTTSASSSTSAPSSATSPSVILMGTSNTNQLHSLIAINSTQLSIKLSKGGNYASWKSQFENLLFGYDLMGYLDGTKVCPPAVIAPPQNNSVEPASQEAVPNPAYHIWLRQDRLLLHAIQVSCTGAAQSIVTRSTTSVQAWNKLESTYANRSNTRKLGLLDSLTNVNLSDKSITDYMQGIKDILDNLELIGHSVDDGAAVIHTLNGLGPAYLSLASAIRARDSPISFEELYDKLIDHETFLKREDAKKGVPQVTAQFNQRTSNRRGRGYQGNSSSHMGHGQSGGSGNTNYNHNMQNFGSANTGGSRNFSTQGSSYRPNHFPHYSQQWCPPYSNNQSRPVCQLCDKVGHTARVCRSRPQISSQAWPQAHTMTANNQPASQNNWVLDTGASHHMTSDLQNLSLHSEYGGSEDIMVGDGKTIPITHIGSTSLSTPSNSFCLTNVLCSPHISHNLVSVSQFCSHNNTSVEFFPDYFLVKDLTTGASLVRGQNKGNLYVWPQSIRPSHSVSGAHQFFMSSQHNVSSRSWHCRLGHPSHPILQRLISSHCLPVTKSETSVSHCSACLCNKSHKLPFGISTLISNKPFEILFTDVWGPAHIQSFDKNKYYVIFVDYFSKYTWLFPLKNKSDVPTVFRRFKLFVENFFNTRIKTVYSDGSGEAQSLGLDLQNLGIQHLKSPPHTPEHVGTAERKHRHVETALTLLHHASMPPKYWSLAFSTAVYLINRMPTKVLGHHSPYFRLFGKEPNYRKLRIFGCLCYPWLRPYTSHKLQPRSRPCVFVGYSTEHSAYLCLDRSTGKVFVSCHVVFVEHNFPFSTAVGHTPPLSPTQVSDWTESSPLLDLPQYPNDPPLVKHSLPDIIPLHVPHVPTLPLPPGVPSPLSTPSQVAQLPPPAAVLLPPAPLSHTGRPPHASHSAEAPAQPESAPPPVTPTSPPPNVIQTRSRNQIFKPKAIFDLHATTHAAPLTEPTSLIQAKKFMEWRNAMSAECDALVSNGTWTLVPSHSSQNVVGCKWIFRIKRHPDGSVARYKALC
ncbi:hypothetical protein LWI29_001354 [Acer saccharum]|uniref:Integrase catalytic domain-containing protein n=1 Tax=Acer saccharum TaxID=4024 RepID=A0AA39S9N7_ACESA|nr:hypothetical protein LWI29_001354 [Acer saccharum]